ncbi:uncharacterized protein LOC128740864 [Sabethes cyaneus]|uniref:uncharacterized protein LOC128740864 n=1 Tax=Sabethes cyaneus TaxID=53552 RepID=UPI00237DDBF0|nr:uncharacterized protein LOC128740864 [Sabethes cyaneus]
MVWTRPSLPAIPVVWHTFQARDGDGDDDGDGRLVTYHVQDLTEDRYEDLVDHFLIHFSSEEPMSNASGLPVVSKDQDQSGVPLWNAIFKENMTLVCYKEGSNEIIGANILAVRDKENYLANEIKAGEQHYVILDILDYVSKQLNYSELYGIANRLVAYGLSVNKRYRRRGIATEILKARVPMCKALGIKLAAHSFSAPGSQRAAAKAGYRTDFEITYDDLAKLGSKYALPGIKSKYFKVMSFLIE